jgi:hypothetical protein
MNKIIVECESSIHPEFGMLISITARDLEYPQFWKGVSYEVEPKEGNELAPVHAIRALADAVEDYIENGMKEESL